jgi:uncharacterized protein (TIRG00374 family)
LLRFVTSLPVRAAVTLALLLILAVAIDWDSVADRLAHGSWELFALGVLVVVVALAIGALRWHVFLRAGGAEPSLFQTFRAYWMGMFANNFLPTGFGGDAVRVVAIAPRSPSTSRAIASVLVDRVTALGCLILLAWLTLVVAPSDVPESLVAVLAIATAAGVVTVMVFVLVARSGTRVGAGRVTRWVARVLAQLRMVASSGSVLAVTTALGLLYQAAMVFAVWVIARSIDLELSFALLAVVTPLVIVVTLMPISIAGFGVREGGYVVLLAEAGVSAADATVLSLLNVAALAIATLPGVVAMLAPAATPRERVPAP